MGKMRKKLLLFFIVIAISLISIFPTKVNAEDLGNFKDENKSHYYLETVPDNPDDDYFEDGEQGRGFFWFMDATEVAGEKFADIINNFANMGFTFNMFLTQLMIAALDLAYEFNFVNVIIDEISNIMSNITGISSSGNFTSNGIFGQLAIFVAIFAVIYAVFMMLFRRSMFQSLGAILQTVICLTIAILLFTNYADFLKGINQVTTEMSALVLGSQVSGGHSPESPNPAPTGLDETSLREKMYDNLWTMFVDRPYLYMMYGETRLHDELTVERVKTILKSEPGSEERLQALETEYNRPNYYITHSKVWERLSFTPIYLIINGITSFLIYGLALFLILFQFWFMMIAVFAPFALLIGAIPGMFNVTKRYFIELGLPLVLKVVVSFGALVVFAISEVLYELDFQLGEMGARVNNAFGFYIAVVIVHWVLFGLLFFLRKRIANIFVNSNRFMKEMKDGLDTSTSPIKSAITGTTTAAGAVGGAMVGGPQGAVMGASIGKTAGETITGDAGVADLAQSAGKAHMYSRFSQGSKGTNLNAITQQNNQENGQKSGLSNESKNNISEFMDKKQFGDDKEKVISNLEKAGIKDVSKSDLNTAHDKILKKIETEKGLKSNYSDMLVSDLKQQHADRTLKDQEDKLRKQQVQQVKEQIPLSNDWMVESVNVNSDSSEQQEKFISDPVNKGGEIPSAYSWISDDVYNEGNGKDISNSGIKETTNMEMSSLEMRNQEIASTKMANTDIPNEKMGNQKIVSSEMTGSEIRNQEMTSSGIAEQEIASTEMTGSEMRSQETTSSRMVEQEIASTELTGSEIRNREMTSSGMAGQEIASTELTGSEMGSTKKVTNFSNYEERKNLESLNLNNQKPATDNFEYTNFDQSNLKSLEDNIPKE